MGAGRAVFEPSAAILHGRTLQSTAESGSRAGWDGHKRAPRAPGGRKVHLAVDTLGYLLTLLVTPANEQERAQVAQLTAQIQQVTGESVQIAFVDQGYTGDDAAQAAAEHGIDIYLGTNRSTAPVA
jgi:IS5 family transposase